jgi:hypothetical protein
MDNLAGERNLLWLNARIEETETRIIAAKKRLAEIESQGDSTAQACRILAVTANYLNILNIRRDLLLDKLRGHREQAGQ